MPCIKKENGKWKYGENGTTEYESEKKCHEVAAAIHASASDAFPITPQREFTPEGFLVATGNLARIGVQEYLGYEVGDAEGHPLRKVKIFRPPEEVFNADSMASFENKPVTIDHPSVAVTVDNWKDLSHGEVRNVRQVGDMLVATVIIKSKDAIAAIQSGKVQLSNGYQYMLDKTPGTFNGEKYDAIQRQIRGNHIAIVDAARCGPVCKVLDNLPNGDEAMTVELKRVMIDGIPLEVSEVAAAAIVKLSLARDAAVAEADKVTAEFVTASDAHAKALAELQANVMTPEARDAMVQEWVNMLADAKKLVPTMTTTGKTCLDVRKEVIAAVIAKDAKAATMTAAILGDTSIDAAEAAAVKAVFNVLVADANQAPAPVATDDLAKAILSKDTAEEPVLFGRALMLDRSRKAYLNKH